MPMPFGSKKSLARSKPAENWPCMETYDAGGPCSTSQRSSRTFEENEALTSRTDPALTSRTDTTHSSTSSWGLASSRHSKPPVQAEAEAQALAQAQAQAAARAEKLQEGETQQQQQPTQTTQYSVERMSTQQITHVLTALASNSAAQQVQACKLLLAICREESNKEAAAAAGAIPALVALLQADESHPVLLIAVEALACLAAESTANKNLMRKANVVAPLVHLLSSVSLSLQFRVLLALRLLTEREVDRNAIFVYGGIEALVQTLSSPVLEVLENVTAAVGNLAAGTQNIKDALRKAGAVEPLVALLGHGEIVSEFAAVALRNMSLKNLENQQAILAAGGLEPLVTLLSKGQELLMTYWDCTAVMMDGQESVSTCWFDITQGYLHIAPRQAMKSARASRVFTPRGSSRPDPACADVYSLLDKFKMSEPKPGSLAMRFQKRGSETIGVGPVRVGKDKDPNTASQLKLVILEPCPATEIKGAVLKMMTRVHLEREFRYGSTLVVKRRGALTARFRSPGRNHTASSGHHSSDGDLVVRSSMPDLGLVTSRLTAARESQAMPTSSGGVPVHVESSVTMLPQRPQRSSSGNIKVATKALSASCVSAPSPPGAEWSPSTGSSRPPRAPSTSNLGHVAAVQDDYLSSADSVAPVVSAT